MNAEVEVHVGDRREVVTVPNAALRTPADLNSAAEVLGLTRETVDRQLAAAREAAADQGGQASLAGSTADDAAPARTMTLPDGRTVELPEGITEERIRGIFEKMRSGGGPQALSAEDREVMARFRRAMGTGGATRRPPGGSDYLFGGDYIVFVQRGGAAQAVPIRTGLTDLDYSEVVSGLAPGDTVLILPSASLVQSQQEWQERIARRQGLPGVQRQPSGSSTRGGTR
jgi:hypothetical protein